MATMRFAELVESNGNEVDFMKDVIAYITGIDSGITCEDDPDDEYDVGTVGTDHFPTFRFSINGEHIFTIKRSEQLSYTSSQMYVLFVNNGEEIYSNTITYMHRGTEWSGNGNRKFSMSYLISSGFYILNITSYQILQSFTILFSESGNNNYSSYKFESVDQSTYNVATIFNISECVLYDVSAPIIGTFLSRFAYKAQPGKVDYIKSSIYINNGLKQFELTKVYDCTEVSPGSTVSLEDGAYLAVGPHQLVKVS